MAGSAGASTRRRRSVPRGKGVGGSREEAVTRRARRRDRARRGARVHAGAVRRLDDVSHALQLRRDARDCLLDGELHGVLCFVVLGRGSTVCLEEHGEGQLLRDPLPDLLSFPLGEGDLLHLEVLLADGISQGLPQQRGLPLVCDGQAGRIDAFFQLFDLERHQVSDACSVRMLRKRDDLCRDLGPGHPSSRDFEPYLRVEQVFFGENGWSALIDDELRGEIGERAPDLDHAPQRQPIHVA